ncbi:hypothetical protein [Nocardioides baculatus]|uniref:Deoxycytidine triphosphate deaminase n=1 Tax=Nocardioides baculatus TaxID=2801337 RepID=A0ABS1L4W4_9ACTN|nr:hypothetical protein [Nocardioides baculatus]MBL0746725.1 hypothetical protein [Nocardioides baculatus]
MDPKDYDRTGERDAALKHNSVVAIAKSDAKAHAQYLSWRQIDPFPDIRPALLNSADIVDYVAQTGMIYPFHPEKLKSASYEVALVGDYVYIDENGDKQSGTLAKGQEITIRKNSITFLTVEPFFRLPDYIALRHNLKIDNVYKGLLVGTGPLIDPGFVGRIALPLHNLTENDYTFVGGEGVIWVEFTKLSKLPAPARPAPVDVAAASPTTASPVAATPLALPGRQGMYVPFAASRTHDRLVGGYVRQAVGSGKWPESSTARIARTANKAKKKVRNLELLIPTIGILGIVVLVVTLFSVFVVPRINDVNGDVDRREDDVTELQNRLAELEDQLADLRLQNSVPKSRGPRSNRP